MVDEVQEEPGGHETRNRWRVRTKRTVEKDSTASGSRPGGHYFVVVGQVGEVKLPGPEVASKPLGLPTTVLLPTGSPSPAGWSSHTEKSPSGLEHHHAQT